MLAMPARRMAKPAVERSHAGTARPVCALDPRNLAIIAMK